MLKAGGDKLQNGSFYNPMGHLDKIDPAKILLIHARDDDVVQARSVERFAKITGCHLIMLKAGGHLKTDIITMPRFRSKIKPFLKP
jgi:predicted alpha/beta hydrolase family esterase